MVYIVVTYTDNFKDLYNYNFSKFGCSGLKLLTNHIDISNFGKTGYRSDSWYYCCKMKIKFLVDAMEKYKTEEYFVMTDCDIHFFNECLINDIVKEAKRKNLDYYGTHDGGDTLYNTGFFVIKNSEEMRSLLNTVVTRLETEKPPHADQSIICELIVKYKHESIPESYYIVGYTPEKIHKNLLYHHATRAKDDDDKLEQHKKMVKSYNEKTRNVPMILMLILIPLIYLFAKFITK